MILVDTSVWAAALRGRAAEAEELSRLLDENAVLVALPVRIEILSGASGRDRRRLRRLLSALPTVTPDESTWDRLDRWVDVAGEAGQRFGFADLMIGALAAQNGASLWSLDSDFARMADLGFVTLYSPRRKAIRAAAAESPAGPDDLLAALDCLQRSASLSPSMARARATRARAERRASSRNAERQGR